MLLRTPLKTAWKNSCPGAMSWSTSNHPSSGDPGGVRQGDGRRTASQRRRRLILESKDGQGTTVRIQLPTFNRRRSRC